MKIKPHHIVFTVLVLVLVVVLADDSIAQCSMCRKIATDGTTTRSIANGLNKGIIYLLAFPYCMLAFIFRKPIIGYISRLRLKK